MIDISLFNFFAKKKDISLFKVKKVSRTKPFQGLPTQNSFQNHPDMCVWVVNSFFFLSKVYLIKAQGPTRLQGLHLLSPTKNPKKISSSRHALGPREKRMSAAFHRDPQHHRRLDYHRRTTHRFTEPHRSS